MILPHCRPFTLVINRSFHRCTSLSLNRIMVFPEEASKTATVTLPSFDTRAQHLAGVLKCESGDMVKVGVVDDGLYDNATIASVSEEATTINLNQRADDDSSQHPPPLASLILACPRPRRLVSLLPVLSGMGVGGVLITGGEKVPKDYFGSKVFWDPAAMRKLLIEGLSQNGRDYRLPTIGTHKRGVVDLNVRKFDENFPRENYVRIVAHPPEPSDLRTDGTKRGVGGVGGGGDYVSRQSNSITDLLLASENAGKRVIVAVGPEGGYTEREVNFLEDELGFTRVGLGPRVLRTDVAVVSLVAIVNELAAAAARES